MRVCNSTNLNLWIVCVIILSLTSASGGCVGAKGRDRDQAPPPHRVKPAVIMTARVFLGARLIGEPKGTLLGPSSLSTITSGKIAMRPQRSWKFLHDAQTLLQWSCNALPIQAAELWESLPAACGGTERWRACCLVVGCALAALLHSDDTQTSTTATISVTWSAITIFSMGSN